MGLLTNTSPRRRLLLGVGGLFLIVGVTLFSFGVYTLVDGGDSAEMENVIDLGEEDAAAILDLPSPTPEDGPSATPYTPPPAPLGESPYTMTIDRIGVNAPVRTYGLDKDQVPEVPVGQDGRDVVAWYDFSAKPGTGSNAVFAAHVTWNGRAVFYDLAKLETGDTITLTSADGTQVVYSVSDKFSVDPKDKDSLQVMFGTDKDVITLITCGGTFTDTNDPVYGGEYDQRLVVRADLVSVNGPGAEQAAGGG